MKFSRPSRSAKFNLRFNSKTKRLAATIELTLVFNYNASLLKFTANFKLKRRVCRRSMRRTRANAKQRADQTIGTGGDLYPQPRQTKRE